MTRRQETGEVTRSVDPTGHARRMDTVTFGQKLLIIALLVAIVLAILAFSASSSFLYAPVHEENGARSLDSGRVSINKKWGFRSESRWAVAIKTGHHTLPTRVPIQLETFASQLPNIILISDREQAIGKFTTIDVVTPAKLQLRNSSVATKDEARDEEVPTDDDPAGTVRLL